MCNRASEKLLYNTRSSVPHSVMIQTGGMRWWVGGTQNGGDKYILMADSCCCMAEPVQHCKVIILQLKKIDGYISKDLSLGSSSCPLIFLVKNPTLDTNPQSLALSKVL